LAKRLHSDIGCRISLCGCALALERRVLIERRLGRIVTT
jgi:hypothetical protein